MTVMELKVAPAGDGWTVSHAQTLFERYASRADAVRQALRQAAALRRAGYEVRVSSSARTVEAARCKRPAERGLGTLAFYTCGPTRGDRLDAPAAPRYRNAS